MNILKPYQLGILGAGHLGLAIAQGVVAAKVYAPAQLLLCNRSAQKRADNQAQGFAVTEDFRQVYTQCEVVVLGLRPQQFPDVLAELAQIDCPQKPLIISIAAGVTCDTIQAALGNDCPIVRTMPTLMITLGLGATALVKNQAATEAQLAQARALFDAMGTTAVFAEEHMLNEVIPYNGSAPAYVYAFMEGMVKSAVQHGIDADDAKRLFGYTLMGAARMALESDKTLQQLIDSVCTAGGTTEQAMLHLQAQDFQGTLAQASDKCIDRAYALGKK